MIDNTTTTIYGSYGTLTVDRSTGLVLHYECNKEECDAEGVEDPRGAYGDIFRIDVATAPKDKLGNRLDAVPYDIVSVGFWTETGEYIEQEPFSPDV